MIKDSYLPLQRFVHKATALETWTHTLMDIIKSIQRMFWLF